MPQLLNFNWCRRGGANSRANRRANTNDSSQDSINHGFNEPQVTSLDELENQYKVDWTKQGFLGCGNFAVVHRGIDLRTGASVAVKRISRQNQDVKTLRTEIAALLKVNGHPNIVRLYDVFIDQRHVVLVMELLEGGELFSRIVNSGAYSERDASKHFRRITEALKFMHENNIVHRDLKPENLVLATPDPDSDIKISDFGLSKVLAHGQNAMTTVCGTSAYAAPEVGLSSSYGPEVDTWSLGVILFVLLAAYHPFDPYGRLQDCGLRQAVSRLQWDFDDQVWESMSLEVKDLIKRLLCPAKERLDTNAILAHPWIAKYQELPETNIAKYTMHNLRNFVSRFGEGEMEQTDSIFGFVGDNQKTENDKLVSKDGAEFSSMIE